MAFSVESKLENGFNKVVLKDSSNQTSVEIIPDCGAILHAFTVLNNDKFINIIDHHTDLNDFKNNVEKGFKSCKMSPFACRIKNATYNFAEEKYTIDKFLLGKSAIHGLLYNAVFLITHQQADDEKASIVLKHQYRGTENGYPFYYDCIITYQLTQNNTLSINTEIINQDKGLIPIQDGWHPYFTFGNSINNLQLEFQSKEKIIFDDEMIPAGEVKPYNEFTALKLLGDAQFDDCFSVNFAECQPSCVLRDIDQKIQLEIHPDKSYPYLQIYTPPHRKSIAIENLSAIPDAFNNGIGLITLQPQTTKNFTTSYKITLIK